MRDAGWRRHTGVLDGHDTSLREKLLRIVIYQLAVDKHIDALRHGRSARVHDV